MPDISNFIFNNLSITVGNIDDIYATVSSLPNITMQRLLGQTVEHYPDIMFNFLHDLHEYPFFNDVDRKLLNEIINNKISTYSLITAHLGYSSPPFNVYLFTKKGDNKSYGFISASGDIQLSEEKDIEIKSIRLYMHIVTIRSILYDIMLKTIDAKILLYPIWKLLKGKDTTILRLYLSVLSAFPTQLSINLKHNALATKLLSEGNLEKDIKLMWKEQKLYNENGFTRITNIYGKYYDINISLNKLNSIADIQATSPELEKFNEILKSLSKSSEESYESYIERLNSPKLYSEFIDSLQYGKYLTVTNDKNVKTYFTRIFFNEQVPNNVYIPIITFDEHFSLNDKKLLNAIDNIPLNFGEI